MAEEIQSFAYKYCLSSMAATVAETGKIVFHIELIESLKFFGRKVLLRFYDLSSRRL